MAGLCSKRQRENIMVDVTFDGQLQSSVRSKLVTEIIKHVLYQRQQIPLPLEQLRRDVQRAEKVSNKTDSKQKPNQIKRGPSSIITSKQKEVLDRTTELFRSIEQLFESCQDVPEVMLVFGSTPVSPKEFYILKFSDTAGGVSDENAISSKSSVRTLFRSLVQNDFISDLKQISPTNLMVLVKASRSANIGWFLPKPNYKVPSRGRSVTLNLNTRIPQGEDLSRYGDDEFDMSGISPLESSALNDSCNTSMSDSKFQVSDHTSMSDSKFQASDHTSMSDSKFQASDHIGDVILDSGFRNESPGTDIVDLNCEATESVNELIWYQAPLVVKGFKHKNLKSSSSLVTDTVK